MKPSKTELSRQTGKHQLEEQRERILAAAEKLFLQQGIDKIRMIDIAAEAGITKMTLYRYFPDIDAIAFEIHGRMTERVTSTIIVNVHEPTLSLESARALTRKMIQNFDKLRDAYRYIGMFDSLYLDNFTDNSRLPQTRDKLRRVLPGEYYGIDERINDHPEGARFNVIVSVVTWFLQKTAMRGELTWHSETVPLSTYLQVFEDMIMVYVEHCLKETADPKPSDQQYLEFPVRSEKKD